MGINPRHVGITVHRKSLLIAFLVADNLAPAAIRITNFVRSAIDCLDFRLARAQGMDVRDTIADPAVVAGVILGGNPMRIEILEIRKISGMLPINDGEKDTGQSLALMGNYLNVVAWLANKLGEFDAAFTPGDVILAGSLTGTFLVKAGGKKVQARFDNGVYSVMIDLE